MKPYLEYNGITYEFEANFQMRKLYEKEVRNNLKRLINNGQLSANDIKEIEELQKMNLDSSKIEELDEETKGKLVRISSILNEIDNNEINEKYCYLMLNQKYGIERKDWDQMLEQYYDDYCDSFDEVYEMLSKVIELVFTRKASTPKKKKLSWVVGE